MPRTSLERSASAGLPTAHSFYLRYFSYTQRTPLFVIVNLSTHVGIIVKAHLVFIARWQELKRCLSFLDLKSKQVSSAAGGRGCQASEQLCHGGRGCQASEQRCHGGRGCQASEQRCWRPWLPSKWATVLEAMAAKQVSSSASRPWLPSKWAALLAAMAAKQVSSDAGGLHAIGVE